MDRNNYGDRVHIKDPFALHKLGAATATLSMCDFFEGRVAEQDGAIADLKNRLHSENVIALEAALAERDAYIAEMTRVVRAREEDVASLTADNEKLKLESETGQPVKMKPALADTIKKAFAESMSQRQADNLVRKNNINRLERKHSKEKEDIEFQFSADDVAAMPGWTLGAWLSSLSIESLVSNSIQTHIQNRSGKDTIDPMVELGFMQQLGKIGSKEVVVAMLRQTTLINDLATALWEGVHELASGVEEEARLKAEREAKEAEAEAEARADAAAAAPAPTEDADEDEEDKEPTAEELAAAQEELTQQAAADRARRERDLEMKDERRRVRAEKREVSRQLAAEESRLEAERLDAQLRELDRDVDSTRSELEKAEGESRMQAEIDALNEKLRDAERKAALAKDAVVNHVEKDKQRVEKETADELTARRLDNEQRKKDQKMAKAASWVNARNLAKTSLLTRKKRKKIVKSDGKAYNESLKLSNAMHLSYAPVRTYFNGLASVVGRCEVEPGEDVKLQSLMFAEHTQREDSDTFFETPNYQMTTNSHIEWYACADPDNGPRKLGIADWPKEQRGAEHGGRKLVSPEAFKQVRDEMNAQLNAVGEPPLETGGFIALRLYTGPMFFKYNTVLRAAVIPYFAGVMKKLCMSNKYTNTMHAITAGISKLSRVAKADMVYRAPGGVLPKSFWDSDDFGVKGGVEMGFMSTSKSKDAAMEYAKFSGVKLLFEVNQGMVARGANISWLSMYPAEDEVLFPPMTACEVQKTRVEGSVVFVELRPGVAACALQDVSLEQQEQEMRLKAARRAEEAAKRKAAIEEVAKVRASWMSSMISVKVSAADAKVKTEKARAAHAEAFAATETDRAAKLREERDALDERLEAMESHHAQLLNEASLAMETKIKALEAAQTMHKAQRLAQLMVQAALKSKLEENEITLKSLVDAQAEVGRGQILNRFKSGVTAAKVDGANVRVEQAEAKLKASLEKQSELQMRTLAAEEKVAKLKKELAENKKMLEKLMDG